MMNFSILLPTRGRPSLVERLFESILRTAHDPSSIEIILYIDADDLLSHGIEMQGLKVTKLINPPGRSMGQIFKECYEISTGRYIMLMNDDAVFRTKDWDLRVIDVFSKFQDDIAFVYCNDLDQGANVPTFPILSRRVCELLGGVCPTGYLNLHIESHIIDIFKQLKHYGHNRIVYLSDVIIEHLHYSIGKSGHDETYLKKDPMHDERLFIALDEERKRMALKLSQYINEYGVKPTVSIIVFGRSNDIYRCLNAITEGKDQTPFEIIVPSYTGTVVFTRLSRKVKVIQMEKTNCLARVCNQAAKEAEGKFLLFINSESFPVSGWIDALLREAETDKSIAVVGCKHINPRNGRIHHMGISFYKDEGETKISYIYKGVKSESPIVNRVREFQAVSINCMLVRKEAFISAGGFDEALDPVEDIDLCLRLRQRGLKIVYTPKAVVYLNGGKPRKDRLLASLCESKVEWDLDRLLEEDGFTRYREGNIYYIKRFDKDHRSP
jgi:GT2 family glycosyltransferase